MYTHTHTKSSKCRSHLFCSFVIRRKFKINCTCYRFLMSCCILYCTLFFVRLRIFRSFFHIFPHTYMHVPVVALFVLEMPVFSGLACTWFDHWPKNTYSDLIAPARSVSRVRPNSVVGYVRHWRHRRLAGRSRRRLLVGPLVALPVRQPNAPHSADQRSGSGHGGGGYTQA